MSEVAGDLALKFAQAAAEKAIGVALDKAFDLSGTGAINARLDEILSAIRQVEAQIDALRADMERMLGQLSYDLAMKSVQPLIDRNQLLAELHTALMTATGAQADGIRHDISRLIDATFIIGLKLWHEAICGSAGQTGLMVAWNSAVYYKYQPFFGPEASRDIQMQWDYLDAQSALTVGFLIEHRNTQLAGRTGRRHWFVSGAIIACRRSIYCAACNDPRTTSRPSPLMATVFTKRPTLKRWPKVSQKNSIMWFLELGPPVAQGRVFAFPTPQREKIEAATAEKVRVATRTSFDEWSLMDVDTVFAAARMRHSRWRR